MRDGGYRNGWSFSDETIEKTISALAETKIDFIEVGYISDTVDRPSLLQCTDTFLSGLKATCNPAHLVAMLSVKDQSEQDIERILRSRAEILDVVRITAQFDQLSRSITAAKVATRLGICASINLTSITGVDPEKVIQATELIADSSVAQWLYLADSRGALRPELAVSLFERVRSVWTGALGFHGHDNLGAALKNTELAIAAGFDIVDCSLGGCGLGGGNTDTWATLRLIRGDEIQKYAGSLNAACHDVAQELFPQPGYADLYRLSGLKNLEQEWVSDIWERYGENSHTFLRTLPSRRYTSLQSVLSYQ